MLKRNEMAMRFCLAGATVAAIPLAIAQSTPMSVTPETFNRAEVDARIMTFQQAGGLNKGLVYSNVTPTDSQPVPRMNRDTIYSGIPIDTAEGFSIVLPQVSDGRYASIYMLDQDHYSIDILREPGTYEFGPQDTRYIVAIARVQVKDAEDESELKVARKFLSEVKVESGSKVPLEVSWNWDEMTELRAEYEAKMSKFAQYPPTFQDTRASGKITPEHHLIAVAGSWGLFPDYETVYISDMADGGTDKCYTATYDVPENKAFWSITMYDKKAYMFSDNAILNASNTKMNKDGSFTVYYGSKEHCGDISNRLDTTEGWRILMRVYRPGESVSSGKYQMPDIKPVSPSHPV